MFENLPTNAQHAYTWGWEDYKPYFDDLMARDLTEGTLHTWLADWSALATLVDEVYSRLYVATTVDTTDENAKEQYFNFLENVAEQLQAAGDKLQRKFIDSGYEPDGFAVPLRQIRGEVDLFREENLPLNTQLQKLSNQYDEIMGAQTVEWNGEDKTISQMRALLLEQDRDTREQAWRKAYARQMQDRDALNDLWGQMLDIRLNIAANADKPTFRDYAWIQRDRYDYTPTDDLRFLDAIEEVVVPAMLRRMEQRKRALGLDALRPWDMHVDTLGDAPLKPFEEVDTLIAGCASIFEQLDPELSSYYNSMRDSGMLDLDNRKGKAPGGYCTAFPLTGQSFIFMNAVATHDDVQTLLHESGHAFHNFESSKLPYIQQTDYPTEFAEVASMTMELLAAPYLVREKGGFYNTAEAARARIEHLEGILNFWPYMAVVDGFQHWVYTHPDDARDPANCDAKWLELWDRFLPGVDWSGLEDIKATGWHRKLHIFHLPFYYIEYGLAQLGAVQIWRNALADAPAALAQYRGALALGNTRKLPDLFAAAGAKLAFDPVTLGEAVALIEQVIQKLETQI